MTGGGKYFIQTEFGNYLISPKDLGKYLEKWEGKIKKIEYRTPEGIAIKLKKHEYLTTYPGGYAFKNVELKPTGVYITKEGFEKGIKSINWDRKSGKISYTSIERTQKPETKVTVKDNFSQIKNVEQALVAMTTKANQEVLKNPSSTMPGFNTGQPGNQFSIPTQGTKPVSLEDLTTVKTITYEPIYKMTPLGAKPVDVIIKEHVEKQGLPVAGRKFTVVDRIVREEKYRAEKQAERLASVGSLAYFVNPVLGATLQIPSAFKEYSVKDDIANSPFIGKKESEELKKQAKKQLVFDVATLIGTAAVYGAARKVFSPKIEKPLVLQEEKFKVPKVEMLQLKEGKYSGVYTMATMAPKGQPVFKVKPEAKINWDVMFNPNINFHKPFIRVKNIISPMDVPTGVIVPEKVVFEGAKANFAFGQLLPLSRVYEGIKIVGEKPYTVENFEGMEFSKLKSGLKKQATLVQGNIATTVGKQSKQFMNVKLTIADIDSYWQKLKEGVIKNIPIQSEFKVTHFKYPPIGEGVMQLYKEFGQFENKIPGLAKEFKPKPVRGEWKPIEFPSEKQPIKAVVNNKPIYDKADYQMVLESAKYILEKPIPLKYRETVHVGGVLKSPEIERIIHKYFGSEPVMQAYRVVPPGKPRAPGIRGIYVPTRLPRDGSHDVLPFKPETNFNGNIEHHKQFENEIQKKIHIFSFASKLYTTTHQKIKSLEKLRLETNLKPGQTEKIKEFEINEERIINKLRQHMKRKQLQIQLQALKTMPREEIGLELDFIKPFDINIKLPIKPRHLKAFTVKEKKLRIENKLKFKPTIKPTKIVPDIISATISEYKYGSKTIPKYTRKQIREMARTGFMFRPTKELLLEQQMRSKINEVIPMARRKRRTRRKRRHRRKKK